MPGIAIGPDGLHLPRGADPDEMLGEAKVEYGWTRQRARIRQVVKEYSERMTTDPDPIEDGDDEDGPGAILPAAGEPSYDRGEAGDVIRRLKGEREGEEA